MRLFSAFLHRKPAKQVHRIDWGEDWFSSIEGDTLSLILVILLGGNRFSQNPNTLKFQALE